MATKSTLNKKLGKCSNVAIYISYAKGTRCSSAYTNEARRFRAYIGCKQPKDRANPYQVQYRWHFKRTPAKKRADGKTADWTDWTTWRKVGASSDASNPDTWLSSNRGANKSSDYVTLELQDSGFAADWAAWQAEYRVRTYNASKRQHGEWATGKVTVYRAEVVADEVAKRNPSGSLRLDFNYQKVVLGTTGKIHITSILDSDGRQLLKSQKTEWAHAPETKLGPTAQSVPPARSGYVNGGTTIPLADLERAVVANEVLRITAWYQTTDGARTYLTSPLTVIGDDLSVNPPRPAFSFERAGGTALVDVFKTDADDDLADVQAVATWTDEGGEGRSASYRSRTMDLTVASTTERVARFYFRDVPLNTEVTYTVTLENSVGKTSSASVAGSIGVGDVAYVNMHEAADLCASAFGNMQVSESVEGKATVERPYGRSLPFAAFSPGRTNDVSFSADLPEEGSAIAPRATWRYWKRVKDRPGMGTLRLPDGQMWRLAVTKVGISQSRDGRRRVSLAGQEVS